MKRLRPDPGHPRFALSAAAVDVATSGGPTGFHEMLQRLIRGARHRITLASLYFGTEDREAALLQDLRHALEQSPELTVELLFDYSRGQRATPNGNAVTFLASLVADYPDRVRFFLHEMPQVQGANRLLPSPLDECVAVFHAKAFVFDDVSILTGANLSDEYFHCRQARYLVVTDTPFADFNRRIVEVTAAHSIEVVADRDANTSFRAPQHSPDQLADALAQLLEELTDVGEANTFIAPLFQHPLLGMQQERELLRQMFSWPAGRLVINTPYPNFPDDYVQALCARIREGHEEQDSLIISPSGRSHSFTTGRGLKAFVPSVYLQCEWDSVSQLLAASAGNPSRRPQFRHYHREGWVFHSKGAWLVDGSETSTVIGSSSFGERSVSRDYDLSFLLVTTDNDLREALAGEVETMLEYSGDDSPVTDPDSRIARFFAPLFRSFM